MNHRSTLWEACYAAAFFAHDNQDVYQRSKNAADWADLIISVLSELDSRERERHRERMDKGDEP